MIRFLRWLWWDTAYCTLRLFGWREKTIEKWLWWSERTIWPWRKFKPCLRHNDAGKQWEIYFASDAHYCERRTLTMEVYVSFDTGRVVGLKVWDALLKPKQEKEEP